MSKPDRIKTAQNSWEEEVLAPTLKKWPERQEEFNLSNGDNLDRVYLPHQQDYLDELNFPGQFPFTRGVKPTMHRGRLWTMRQYSGFGSARETNQRFHYLMEQGQTGLSVAFDLPTQMGYDSDHQMAAGEVGKVGVAICSLADMEILLEGIPLERISTSMTINATAIVLLCMYIAVAEKQGVKADSIKGTIQNDILKEYVARGTYIFPPGPSMRLITDIFSFCHQNVPKFNTISISGYHIREAGANAVQELAFTLANGLEYVRAAQKSGLQVDQFAGRLSFFFNVHNNFLEEVAKFRAARRLWAKLMRREGAKKPGSQALRFHAQTAGSTLTAQQAENNIIRVTLQALAAVLGGVQSLHTNSWDEALALPSEESVRIALRTQQVIAHESGVADSIDLLGGSYALEQMTDKLENQASKLIDKIEQMGGVTQAIETGFIQKAIADSAYQYQLEVERCQAVIVGVNKFQVEEEKQYSTLKLNEKTEDDQIKKLRQVRQNRDAEKATRALKELESAARGQENLMPYVLAAVKSYATLGEISDSLRQVFGVYQPAIVV